MPKIEFNEKNPQVRTAFNLPKLMVEDLKKDAQYRGISMSELLRRILSNYLNKY
jgi:hypothetical protein